ncbi:hypothetical protein SDC9_159296 [bioreactor metagenome]|uniref:Uncharacterized protein n=1 Tax=bioreactor metagenome TaxID=1076179 RepID=A0A645FCI3_9ZZZZ
MVEALSFLHDVKVHIRSKFEMSKGLVKHSRMLSRSQYLYVKITLAAQGQHYRGHFNSLGSGPNYTNHSFSAHLNILPKSVIPLFM